MLAHRPWAVRLRPCGRDGHATEIGAKVGDELGNLSLMPAAAHLVGCDVSDVGDSDAEQRPTRFPSSCCGAPLRGENE